LRPVTVICVADLSLCVQTTEFTRRIVQIDLNVFDKCVRYQQVELKLYILNKVTRQFS